MRARNVARLRILVGVTLASAALGAALSWRDPAARLIGNAVASGLTGAVLAVPVTTCDIERNERNVPQGLKATWFAGFVYRLKLVPTRSVSTGRPHRRHSVFTTETKRIPIEERSLQVDSF